MKSLGLARYALTVGAASALLAGCGGSQPSIGAPGAMPQSRAIAGHANVQDLLYVGDFGGYIHVFSYPHSKLVRTLKRFASQTNGLCADNAGNVFVTTPNESGGGTIFELNHGGTKPVASLSDPGVPGACAVDPTTGNLAVSNQTDSSNPSNFGDVAIYQNAEGTPTIYENPNSPYLGYCSYDNAGNLFVDTWYGPFILSELPKGSNSFQDINVTGFPAGEGAESIQWDGANLAITYYPGGAKIAVIYRIEVSGTTASIVGTTTIKSRRTRLRGQTWILSGAISGFTHGGKQVSYWAYPAGGLPESDTKVLRNSWSFSGLAVSVAP